MGVLKDQHGKPGAASSSNSDAESGHGHADSKNVPRMSINSGAADSQDEIHQQSGITKVEAFNKALYNSGASGRILLYVLGISLALTMFAFALDQGITSQFNAIGAAAFNSHAELGAVNAASQIIRAISKPFLGKLADITSRPTTYVVVLVAYIIGFACAASSPTLAAYIVGTSLTAFGKSGLDLLSDIIIGDLTPLEWRGFWSGMLSTPFLVTTFVNGQIANYFLPDRWRWGLVMFAVMMPVLLAPTIVTLYSMQGRAKKMGMISMGDAALTRKKGIEIKGARQWGQMAKTAAIEMDLIGLVLLGFAFALILLPLNLAPSSGGGWRNPSMIAMLVCGVVILGLFIAYEALYAKVPITPKRILVNRAFLAALIVDVFNQMASATRNTYFSSYIYIIKDWPNDQWTYFIAATTLTLCFMSPIGGLIQRATHRYKTLMIIGAAIKLIGYGIQMNGIASTEDTARLAASQVLLGMGAWSVIGARVGSQASVPHQDLSTVISVLSLWSTMASSIGSTIAATIWQSRMLNYMREDCPPGTPESTLKAIYGSIKTLRTKYAFEDPIRQGAIRAYTRTNGIIFVVAVILAAIPVIAPFVMPDYYLGKQQNAITNTDVTGESVFVPQRDTVDETRQKPGLWQRFKNSYNRET